MSFPKPRINTHELSSNVKSSPPHNNKSTFIVAMSDIIVPTIQLLVVVT